MIVISYVIAHIGIFFGTVAALHFWSRRKK